MPCTARLYRPPCPAVVQDRVFATTISNMISYFTRVANGAEQASGPAFCARAGAKCIE